MNKIFLNYLLKNFLKTFMVFVLVFYCFGVILNLFEEIGIFQKYGCKYIYSTNANKYFYTEYDYKNFAIYHFSIKYVVHDENKK